MLFRHRIARPDGRPLYRYRFTSQEYQRACAKLESDGKRALDEPEGCALFVMALAEWFRRDRDGGGWSWDPPLAALGFKREDRGAGGRNSLRYTEMRDAVLKGLRWWKRPGSKDIEGLRNVWAVVRESGLPLSEVRRASWLRAWVCGSVVQMFKGVPLKIAVEQERKRRANSETLSEVISEVVCELVEKIFEFKRLVGVGDSLSGEDPVLRLTRIRPGWLDELPVPAEAEDLRALIADALRTSARGEDVFSAERVLYRSGGAWRPALEIGLEGEIDLFDISAELRDALEGASRAQLFLRTSKGRASSRAIALIERSFSSEGEALTVRPLGRSQFDLALADDVTLVCQVGERPPVLIAPRGASPQLEDVLVFASYSGGDSADRLRMVSNASVDHPGERLFLLVDRKRLDEIDWRPGSERENPEPVDEKYVLVGFSGEARLECDGLTRVWRTGCAESSGAPLLLDGRYTTACKPTAFIGQPRVLCRDRGALVEASRADLLWRPKGRGQWRLYRNEAPFGDVEIGLAKEGVLIGSAHVVLLPDEFQIDFAPSSSARRVILSGLAGALVKARTDGVKAIAQGPNVELDLAELTPGAVFEVGLSWGDRRVRLKLRDTSLSKAILENDLPIKGAQTVGASSLFRYSAWSQSSDLLLFELAGYGSRVGFVRKVTGDTPLTVYRDDIRALLSQTNDHEARVDILWRGGGRALTVRRYDLDPPRSTWERPVDETVAYLRALGFEHLIFIPLLAPENGCQLTLEEAATAISFEALAHHRSGPGPWVLTGRGANHSRMRPVFIAARESSVPANKVQAASLLASGRRNALMAVGDTATDRREFARLALATVNAARKYQVPPISFDILGVLAQTPQLAVYMLAGATGRTDLDAVFDLESELALVWPTIKAETWVTAFTEQFEFTRTQLLKAGIDSPYMAASPLIEHLAQVSHRPDLRLHAAQAAHAVMLQSGMDEAERRDREAPFSRALCEIREYSYSDLAQAMVKRRVDGVPPPRLTLDTGVLGDLRGRFACQFDCVLAAPRAAARIALGLSEFGPKAASQFRLARLYDPDFFDHGVSRAMLDLHLSAGK
ncbi:STY4851/ECs_5259 family protein [Alkalicaulis satelles]|nr:STY4851/ECs_5259 family protein [Alkalicaulis satelles]